MFKVRGGTFKRDFRGNFYIKRVVGIWNQLPEEAVKADVIMTFEGHLDGYG